MSPARNLVVKSTFFLLLFIGIDCGISAFMLRGLERYFGLDAPAELLFIGHSRTVLAINKRFTEEATGKRISVYAREGADIADREIMLQQYFNRFPDSNPLVVYDVNPGIFNAEGLSKNSYVLFYPFIREPVVLNYLLRSGTDGFSVEVRKYIHLLRYNDVTIRFALRGWAGKWDNLKTTRISEQAILNAGGPGDPSLIRPDTTYIETFRNSVQYCLNKGSKVLLLYIPGTDAVVKDDSPQAQRVMRIFRQLDSSNTDILYKDYSPWFSTRHELYFDPVHFNRTGQLEFSKRLVHDLASYGSIIDP